MAKEETEGKTKRNSYLGKTLSLDFIISDYYFEKKLSSYNNTRLVYNNANIENRDKGIAWFESGLSLEDAPEELRNDAGFKIGFEIGRRRARARELDENDKIKKSK